MGLTTCPLSGSKESQSAGEHLHLTGCAVIPGGQATEELHIRK